MDDVVQSGVNTYTVTCVAPGEFPDKRERAVAYLRRDREFVGPRFSGALMLFALMSQVMNVWTSLVIAGSITTAACFAWATK